ncbi:hypothetical protein KZZ20_04200 [Methylacidiphilum fumariolicum]|nr:hypothetical protein [Candidatus Methylacidiphilum fumarolicum]MBW6414717.1 hypothetical protein [Candidatus Methylacidiphilum fumarolicum]
MDLLFCQTPQQKEAAIKALQDYLPHCRWFSSKSQSIVQLEFEEEIFLDPFKQEFSLLFFRVTYDKGPEAQDLFLLPLQRKSLPEAQHSDREILFSCEDLALCWIEATSNNNIGQLFLELIVHKKESKGRRGSIRGSCSQLFFFNEKDISFKEKGQFLGTEQSNSSYIFDQKFFFKLYRKLEAGENPESEILSYLTEKTPFGNIPSYLGKMELFLNGSKYVIGLLTKYVPNEGNGWKRALSCLERYHKVAQELLSSSALSHFPQETFHHDCFGLDAIYLGERTAELHLALSSAQGIEGFEPEPLQKTDLKLLFEEAIQQIDKKWINASANPWFQRILSQRNFTFQSLTERISQKLKEKITDLEEENPDKIRIHGDFHLGQVLWTGSDYFIIDFEGEPNRSIDKRRMLWPALKDVAGMLRSFHYAAYSFFSPMDDPSKRILAAFWYSKIVKIYLDAYRKKVRSAPILPSTEESFFALLDFFLIEKAVYEVGYELGSRPAWVPIPLLALLDLIE